MICIFFSSYDPCSAMIYSLSLHDALPISVTCLTVGADPQAVVRGMADTRVPGRMERGRAAAPTSRWGWSTTRTARRPTRSEEHTSDLQSPCNLVCRLLLAKKNNGINTLS